MHRGVSSSSLSSLLKLNWLGCGPLHSIRNNFLKQRASRIVTWWAVSPLILKRAICSCSNSRVVFNNVNQSLKVYPFPLLESVFLNNSTSSIFIFRKVLRWFKNCYGLITVICIGSRNIILFPSVEESLESVLVTIMVSYGFRKWDHFPNLYMLQLLHNHIIVIIFSELQAHNKACTSKYNFNR